MEKLSPEIALDKYHEMWNAMAKAEKEKEITEKDFDRVDFRTDFKKNWCKERGENPINNCYLCEYALQAYQESFGFDYSRVPSSRDYIMTKHMCRFCPVLWSENRDNNIGGSIQLMRFLTYLLIQKCFQNIIKECFQNIIKNTKIYRNNT